jgi:phosphoribosylformylglycinamidine synthase
VAECCRNPSTAGALPIGTTNNLNFGNPEKPEIMAQIVESIEGLAEACSFFDVPVTGGNVSLYNETLGTPIFPTPVVGIVGILPTVQPIGIHFRQPGLPLILIGGLGEAGADEFGGTQYAKAVLDSIWGRPPKLDMDYERRVQLVIRTLVREKRVDSAHDLGEGGLALALAECSFGASGIGAAVALESDMAPELLLFHEGPSRVLVSTSHPDYIFSVCAKNDVQAVTIGATLEARVTIRNRDKILIDSSVTDLKSAWSNALEHLLHNPVLV